MSPRVECSKTLSISGLVQTLTAVLTCAASVVAILNKLTPTFAGLLDFRVRYIILLLVLCSLSGLGSWIFFARHECPSSIAHLLVQHRTYAKGDRILGGFVSIVSILAIVVASSDFKYWKGREGPLQGRVLDKNGDPVSGVQVDALNVDKISVAMVPETTDSYGRFVLEIQPAHGMPVYFELTSSECTSFYSISQEVLNAIGYQEREVIADSISDVAVPYQCPAK